VSDEKFSDVPKFFSRGFLQESLLLDYLVTWYPSLPAGETSALFSVVAGFSNLALPSVNCIDRLCLAL